MAVVLNELATPISIFA